MLPPYYMSIPRAQRRELFTPPAWAHGTSEGWWAYACLCRSCRAWARDDRRSRYSPRAERARNQRRRAAAREPANAGVDFAQH